MKIATLVFILLISVQAHAQDVIVLEALSFEKYTNIEGYVPAYQDVKKKALAIKAGNKNYRDQYAAAQTTFNGKTGKYAITLVTLLEEDGESTYKVKVGNQYVGGTIKNAESEKNNVKQRNTLPSKVKVKNGDIIQVEFMAVTNGKIPEGEGTAYARGRWTQLELTP